MLKTINKASLKRVALISIVAALSASMTGCMSVKVTEKDFIRPDRLTGYQAKEPASTQFVQNIKPNFQVQEQSIAVNESLSLNGLRLEVGTDGNSDRPTILYFGGNLSHADESIKNLARQTAACSANIITFDYRGYGRTKGDPSIATLQEDALRIYDQVRQATKGKLYLHGQSLGSFMSGHIMQNRSVDGVILEATATTIADVVDFKTPWYAVPFVRFEYDPSTSLIDNRKSVSQFQQRSLVIVGEKDELFGPDLGKKVYEAIPSKQKQLLVVKDGNHTGMMNKLEVQQGVCSFISGR